MKKLIIVVMCIVTIVMHTRDVLANDLELTKDLMRISNLSSDDINDDDIIAALSLVEPLALSDDQQSYEVVKSRKPFACQPSIATSKQTYVTDTISPLWAFPVTLYTSFANRSFDTNGQNAPLATYIFQQNTFTLSDISLFINLSGANKVRIYNGPALPPERVTVPVGNVDPAFGSFASDEYTYLLAPTVVAINAEQQETGASLTFLRRLEFDECFPCIRPVIGITIPVVNKLHIMDLQLIGGSLLRDVFIPNQINRDDSSKPFFRNFTDVYDFFVSGILGPKGLAFDSRQRRTGFGDITLFVFADFLDMDWPFTDFQAGANLVCPSGGREDASKVWDPVLGNGGGYELDFSLQGAFCGCNYLVNPVFRIVAQIGLPFKYHSRIPQLKQLQNGPQVVNTVPGLLAPSPFGAYYVDDYSQYDANVPYFADSDINIKRRYGSRISLMLGNYIDRPACLDCRIGVFYEYMYKGKDSVSAQTTCNGVTPQLNATVATGFSKQQAHRISWNLAHQFTQQLELTVGSYHVVAGRNLPREQRIFISGLFHF
jgi:hypothetical protein